MIEIPSLPNDPVKDIRNHRPAIDYGRRCWCALCVDICPSSSLSLSREYVHICDQEHIDSYFILPDPNGMHKQHFGEDWQKTEHSDLLSLTRSAMAELEPKKRIDNFDEIVDGFSPEQAILEASRCVQCGMCHDSCPTNMHAPEYIRAIWDGDNEEAIRQIYRTNPFANVCGRVCTKRCEDACSIGIRGEPIAIRWLKRYAMDSVSHERIKEIINEGNDTKSSGKKIAIIGAGPAGLTAAFDLVRSGHKVEVFEALPNTGGMTRYGIPNYRLPFDSLQQDIDVITSMGVKINYNSRIGKNKRLSTLRKNFDAVILAIGLSQGRQSKNETSSHKLLASQKTLGDILKVAIQFEQTARDFYTDLIPKVSKRIRYLVEELAEEEQQHFDLFSQLLKNPGIEGHLSDKVATPPSNQRFSEAIQAKNLGKNPDDQSILQYALFRAQAAMEQYTSLSKEVEPGPIKDLFTFLAHEETEHKNELEKLYYEVIHSGGV